MANHTKRNTGMRYGRRKKQLKKVEEHGIDVPIFTESYGLLLLQETAALTEKRPREGLVSARNMRQGFLNHSVNQKAIENRALAGCFECMSSFIEASAIRLLGNPQRAIKILGNKPRCTKCTAEYHRFKAAFQMDLVEIDLAENEIKAAFEIYKNMDGDGHNLSENGVGSCLSLMAHIKHTAEDNLSAIDLALEALAEISIGIVSRSLYFSVVGNLAIYLFFEGRVEEAEPYLCKAEANLKSDECTVPRMMCLWLRGLIFFRRKHEGTAKRYLTDALSCAVELGYQREATMITADYLAILTLTGSSFWLLKKTLADAVVPAAANQAAEQLESALNKEDLSKTWISIRSLRHYEASNSRILPYMLPELRIL